MPLLRRTVTALFCDLAGSTALAESLADPEAIHDVLTRYLRAMKTVIERHGGTVEKFAGDAILGAFGVPLSHEDDALRAVRAALEMREALSTLNAELDERWGVSLEIKIGINSGEFLTGDSIAGHTMTLGDPMNVAARLEQTADPGDIVLGEPTVRLVGAAVRVEDPRPLALKGKSGDVPAYRLVALTPETARTRRFSRAMVGRADELQALRGTYRRVVQSGDAAMVVVTGSPGIGKSRLVSAATSEMEGEATVYWARCPSYGERTTFWPLAQVVRAHADLTESDDDATVEWKLGRVVEALVEERGEQLWLIDRLASLTGLATGEPSIADAPDATRAWRQLLEYVAGLRPLVLVFEDLHWAEDLFLDFLGRIARCAAPILLLCTARPDLDEHRLNETSARIIRLEPLRPDEIGRLVEELAGERLPSELRDQVIARAGGNALFAEALVTLIAERGLQPADRVPETVEALVGARLDALPQEQHAMVFDAAVVGTSIRASALSSMTGLDTRAVEEALIELVQRDILRPGGPPNEYEFRHELAREVAYKRIPRAARFAKHRSFVAWLEGLREDAPADLLAYHSERAFAIAVEAREPRDVRGRLAEHAFLDQVRAAQRSLQSSDPASAAKLLVRAAQALSEIADPDLDAVALAGRLLVTLGRWRETVELLDPFADSAHLRIPRELGVALCKLHRDDPRGDEYRRGQALLDRAASYGDVDAIASLAGTWKGIDEEKVRTLYRRASDFDPADPYALGNLLECEIQAARDLSPVDEMRDRIAAAIERCRQQVADAENLPWAHFDLGKLHLVLGLPSESLSAYAKAIDLSPAAYMVETSLASLTRLAEASDDVLALESSRDLLELALRAKFTDEDAGDGSISAPVVVIAGGTSSEEASRSEEYRPMLLDTFGNFEGNLISGGTAQGVSGLAGDLAQRYPQTLRVIGYLPGDAAIEADGRYAELRRTSGTSFSPREPLTYWADVLRAGVRPSQVKVIGIGGGAVAAAEYAIALALGATVGIVAGSGRAADEILADSHWSSSARLKTLAPDPAVLGAFLRPA